MNGFDKAAFRLIPAIELAVVSAVIALLAAGCVHPTVAPGLKSGPITLAVNGQTDYVIVLAADRSASEQHAAAELSRFLKEVTGAEFAIVVPEERGQRPAIAVGPGAARRLIPGLDLTNLGQDGIVIQSCTPHLVLTGGPGAARGTLYAVYTFLEDSVGCRWWAPRESYIPRRAALVIPDLKQRYVPTFEYREPFLFVAFDPDWGVRNKCNGEHYHLDETRGGWIGYRGYNNGWGFVHTFNTLVPPDEFFPKHPEWFAEIDGKRVGQPKVQWCLTNPDLLAFCIQRVKATLRGAPPDSIVSVSQNDGLTQGCQCAKCIAIEKEEGSPSGPLLRFVNAVADAVKDEYPRAAIDTLAYQYTQKPPRLTKPRPNVIIRLCDINCSFAQTLDHERNRAFAEDLRGWAAICQRIYIWDYITNFGHYLLPWPNLRVLGPNVRFFAKHGVKGVFEQGASSSPGAEFAELRAWVLAKLLWNPALDDRALIQQFVDGYYGAAAPGIVEYIRLLHDTAEKTGCSLNCCGTPATAPYLTLDLLTKAEALFQKAEASVQGQPDILPRVQMAHASIQYVVLSAWPMLKQEAQAKGQPWPFGQTLPELLNRFLETCKTNGVTRFNEGGVEPMFLQLGKFGPLGQRPGVEPPSLCKGLNNSDWIDFQEDQFRPGLPKEWLELRPDPAASNGKAAWMPATHNEWAVQVDIPYFLLWMDRPDDEWTVYAVVRVEKKGKGEGTAFACGIYDARGSRPEQGALPPLPLSEIKDEAYHVYQMGKMGVSASSYIWLAPTRNADNVAGIWVDRIFMVRQPSATDR